MVRILIICLFLVGCTDAEYEQRKIDAAAEKIINRKDKCSKVNSLLSNKDGWEIIQDQNDVYCFIIDNSKIKHGLPGYSFSDSELSAIIRYETIKGNHDNL